MCSIYYDKQFEFLSLRSGEKITYIYVKNFKVIKHLIPSVSDVFICTIDKHLYDFILRLI